MKRKKKWEQWYVDYMIKSPVLFLVFLGLGILLFFCMTLSIYPEDGKSLLQMIFIEAGSSL